MAYTTSNHTIRTVAGHGVHILFPSRLGAFLAMAIEVVAMLAHLPLVIHVLLAVLVHLAIAVAAKR